MREASLKELSNRATPGEWEATGWGTDIFSDRMLIGMTNPTGDGNGVANRAFIVALVNAYRRGDLHDATALAEAKAQARRDALEEAAKAAEFHAGVAEFALKAPAGTAEENSVHRITAAALVQHIRALATAPAETEKPETGWRDISTCPADGRPIIAFGGRFDVPTATQADGDWWNSTVAKAMQSRPTHWMPLPNPPQPTATNTLEDGRSALAAHDGGQE